MKELSKLQSLVESKMPSEEERSRRKWFTNAEEAIRRVETMVEGRVLKKLLEDGKFPATESKAMITAFGKFLNEFEDLQMAMMSEFDDYGQY